MKMQIKELLQHKNELLRISTKKEEITSFECLIYWGKGNNDDILFQQIFHVAPSRLSLSKLCISYTDYKIGKFLQSLNRFYGIFYFIL